MKTKRQIFFKIFFSQNKIADKNVIYESQNHRQALNFYEDYIKKNNEKILCPVRYTSNVKEVRPQKFFLLLVKVENDTKEVLKCKDFYKEEKFYVYGLKKRLDVEKLIKQVFFKFKNNYTKVVKFKNKIVLDDFEEIECILAKNTDDCNRLYLTIKKLLISYKIKSFLFLGEVPDIPKKNKTDLIKKLVDFTGLSHYQFKRRKTRH